MPGKRSTKVLRVAELFAGVGGFRIGLEQAVSTSGRFKVVYSNQWEPGRKRQHASEVYVARFGADGHSCKDISTVEPEEIPEHDVLVGGFPCQDYSVASTLRNSKGLLGKKGVLWWEIHRLLSGTSKPPRFLVLENVDRLLSSPARQRGRDLAVMLRSLASLGYAMEWRVVNAADYGMPQRRKRVFLIGRRSDGPGASNWSSDPKSVLEGGRGVLARAFPCRLTGEVDRFELADDLVELSASFGLDQGGTRFRSAGFMVNGNVFTGQVAPDHRGPYRVLGDVLEPTERIPKEFFIPRADLGRWRYLKGAKREERSGSGNGYRYTYSEGAMAFPDAVDRPSRTIITGEGGSAPSRFKHVVQASPRRFRRLLPVELERLNMFPDDHTAGVPDTWRAFFMGNALVVGVVERIGRELLKEQE